MKPKADGVKDHHVEMGMLRPCPLTRKKAVFGPKSSDRQGHPEALYRAHGAPRHFNTWYPHLASPNCLVCLPACLPAGSQHDTQWQWQGQATGSQWVGRPEPL